MTRTCTTVRRLASALGLAALLAAIAIPAAAGATRSPDQQSAGLNARYGNAWTRMSSRDFNDLVTRYGTGVTQTSADAALQQRADDIRGAALDARYGLGTLRSPDTADAALLAHDGTANTIVDGRSPDTADAALQAHEPVGSSPGFDWGDAGLGLGIALAVLCLVLLAAFATRRNRGGKRNTVATA